MVFIIPLLLGLVLYALISAGVRSKGTQLGKKFQSIGDMKGKTLDEIRAVVGDPVSTSNVGNGKTLYQWAAPGFSVALLFEGQMFHGISSAYGANVS
jgi:hypothetical protein